MKIIRNFGILSLIFLAIILIVLKYNIGGVSEILRVKKPITEGIINRARNESKKTFRFSRLFLRLILNNNDKLILKIGQFLFLNILDTDFDGWLTYDEGYYSFSRIGLVDMWDYYFKYQYGEDDSIDLPRFMQIIDKIQDMERRAIDVIINEEELYIELSFEYEYSKAPEDYFNYYLFLREHMFNDRDVISYQKILDVIRNSSRAKLNFMLFLYDIITQDDDEMEKEDLNTFFSYYERFVYTEEIIQAVEKIKSEIYKNFSEIDKSKSYSITKDDILRYYSEK